MFFEVRPSSPSINPSMMGSTFISSFLSPAVPSPSSIHPLVRPSIHSPCTSSPSQASLPRLHAGPYKLVSLPSFQEGNMRWRRRHKQEVAGWRQRWRGWKGWEGWWRCCQEERDVELWDGGSFSALSDSSVKWNDCSALGWDEWRPYTQEECKHVHVCKWSCTYWFMTACLTVKSCTHTDAQQSSRSHWSPTISLLTHWFQNAG